MIILVLSFLVMCHDISLQIIGCFVLFCLDQINDGKRLILTFIVLLPRSSCSLKLNLFESLLTLFSDLVRLDFFQIDSKKFYTFAIAKQNFKFITLCCGFVFFFIMFCVNHDDCITLSVENLRDLMLILDDDFMLEEPLQLLDLYHVINYVAK